MTGHQNKQDSDYTWDGEERRAVKTITLRDIEEHIDRRIAALFEEHSKEEFARYDQILAEIKSFKSTMLSAFPENDPVGHRNFHVEAIEVINDLKDMMRGIRNKTVAGLVWGLLILIGLSIWEYVRIKLSSGSGLP